VNDAAGQHQDLLTGVDGPLDSPGYIHLLRADLCGGRDYAGGMHAQGAEARDIPPQFSMYVEASIPGELPVKEEAGGDASVWRLSVVAHVTI
jgi:hypothetical protein